MEKQIIEWNTTGKKVVWIVIQLIGIYLVFRYVLPLVIPFVVAGIVAMVYYPLLRKVGKRFGWWKEKPKNWVLTLAVVSFYLIVLLGICIIGGYLSQQGQSILLNLPFYQAKLMCVVQDCCCRLDTLFHMGNGTCFTYIEQAAGKMSTDSMNNMLPKLTTYSVQMAGKMFGFLFSTIITIMATIFMLQDYEYIRSAIIKHKTGKKIFSLLQTGKDTLKAYLKAQGVIMLLDGIVCTIAFFLIRQPYYLVLGPAVGIVDALPVLGAGIILFPYMLFLLLTKEFGKAGILLLAYVICLFIRQITEPKMIGSKIGIRPLYTIAAMYIGFKLFGVAGFLLGPITLMILKEDTCQENGIRL